MTGHPLAAEDDLLFFEALGQRDAAAVTRLVEAFRMIHATRMRDLPFLNPALTVEGVGFRHWQDRLLGILITPWFMNLMLLPTDAAACAMPGEGEKQTWTFPAGRFDFVSGMEEGIGWYQSCALFSPMSGFADQESARATAVAALEALFRPSAQEVRPPAAGDSLAPPPVAPAAMPGTVPLDQPLSRRALLRGAFFQRRGRE